MNPDLDAAFKQIRRDYAVIFPANSMLEVGFDPRMGLGDRQVARANEIYSLTVQTTSEILRSGKSSKQMGEMYVVNPSSDEWFAARTTLLRHMKASGMTPKNSRELAFDALIHYCAWNMNAAVITDNLKDFVLLNTLQVPHRTSSGALRHVPTYSLNDLLLSLTSPVSYPENLPADMRKGFKI